MAQHLVREKIKKGKSHIAHPKSHIEDYLRMLNCSILLMMALRCLNLCVASDLSEVGQERVRGITISTHGIGRDWGEDVIVPTMTDIKAVGANWVAIHPYARVSRDGSIRYGDIDLTGVPAHWIRPIREAHAQGLKICIKPHVAYWGSGFSWRGEIAFEDDAAWERFWTGYRAWILRVVSVSTAPGAELSTGNAADQADHFGLLVEMRSLPHRRRGDAVTR